jgi:hypothetical protein
MRHPMAIPSMGAMAESTLLRVQASRAALGRSALAGPAAFVALVGVAAASRPATYSMPVDENTGAYLYVGKVILDGGAPYRDAADNKGPVTYLLFAGIRAVAGSSELVVRLVLLLFAGAAALALAALVRRWAGLAAGAVAGVVLATLGSANAVLGADPDTEQFALAPLATALWLAGREGALSAAGAGALAAAAVAMNVGLVVAVPFVAWELLRVRAGRSARVPAAALGAAAVPVGLATWLGLAGALRALVVQVGGQALYAVHGARTLPRIRVDQPSVASGLGLHRLSGLPMPWAWAAALAGCALAIGDRRLRGAALLAAAWTLAMWARVKLSTYEHEHFYVPALPGIAAGVALGLAALWRRVPALARTTRRQVAVAATVLVPLTVAYVAIPQRRLEQLAPRQRWGGASGAYGQAYPVAAFIRRATRPGQALFMAGGAGEVYWLADRRAPTALFAFYPLAWHPAYRASRLKDLLARPPAAVGVLPNDIVDCDVQRLLGARDYRLAYRRHGALVWLRGRGGRWRPRGRAAAVKLARCSGVAPRLEASRSTRSGAHVEARRRA